MEQFLDIFDYGSYSLHWVKTKQPKLQYISQDYATKHNFTVMFAQGLWVFLFDFVMKSEINFKADLRKSEYMTTFKTHWCTLYNVI